MSDRGQRLQRLFHEASKLDPAQREAFLDEQCGDDRALREEVRSLLANLTAGDRLFEATSNPFMRPLEDHSGSFAHFELQDSLGAGGGGVVFRAFDTQNERVVALKTRLLADSEAERLIQAQLNHPSIATLYHSGVFQGIPWISMEYVEGEHLDVWCDRVPLMERLRVFRRVVEAVQFAHRKNINHCDIKPSNILVTADGSVKLLDFGIASRVDGASDGEAPALEGRPMTPLYASPEQVSGARLDTASDVFSLGVVLYRLLTGVPPFRASTLVELQRQIREQEAMPPSRVAGRGGGLSRRQWADLDALCAKAMRKSADQRYAGAGDMLRDVDAFLAHLPLDASRGGPAVYHVTRFLRRHRTAAISLANVSLLLVIIVASFSRELARERDHARDQALLAERTLSFTEGVFLGDKNAGIPNAPLRPLVERASSTVAGLRGEPQLQSRLYGLLAAGHQSLGEFDRALAAHAQSVALARKAHGFQSPQAITSQAGLARFLAIQSRVPEAEALAKETLDAARSLPASEPDALGAALIAAARVAQARDQHKLAAQYAEQAAALHADVPGHELPQADALNLLAISQHNLHTFDAALATNHRVLALHRRHLGDRHALLADDYLNIGLIHTIKGRWEEARSSLDEALRINRGWYGDNHPEVAAVYMKQSDLLRMQDQWDRSEKQVAAALAIYHSIYPLVHPRPANALNSMAMVQLARNDYAKAENNFRLAYAIYCALFGTSHSNSIVILTNVGDVHLAAKRLDRAKAIYEQALQPLRANLQSSPAAVIRLRLAKILLEQRRDAEAKAELQEVHAIFAKTIGPDSPNAKVALRYLNLARKAEQERSR